MKKSILIVTTVLISFVLLGFQHADIQAQMTGAQMEGKSSGKNLKKAVFAGGCFWCVEADFEKVNGVVEAISGYTGGHQKNPTYKEVSADKTGHVEAVEVTYDSELISYEQLLDVFWQHVDPTDPGGQFVDRGSSYLTAIFYADDEQRRLAEESKRKLEASKVFDKPIVTKIAKLDTFYVAEDYHQDYYKRNPIRYKIYRLRSGRDKFLNRTWEGKTSLGKNKMNNPVSDTKYSKPSDEVLMSRLTPIQYKVTQREGTEPPYKNEYWDNKKAGIYVDIVSGEPLFSSLDKYDSKTGWPSFTKPLVPGNIVEREDRKLFRVRTEVRSKHGDSHLGHVFDDGPPPTGLRYCVNSAALRFIPTENLEKEGYSEYLKLFSKSK